MPPQMPMAAPRLVAGKVAMMTAIVCGSSSAEPRPWTARRLAATLRRDADGLIAITANG